MSVSVNGRRTRLRSALAVVLTVLVLLPTAALFGRVLQENSTLRENAELEQQGVEYMTALSSLISGLAKAQSSALQNVKTAPEELTAAVSKVQGMDESHGDALGTTQRWTDLRQRIENLKNVTGTDDAVFQAHVEATDLTLELYGTVLENSKLNHDPDADIWFLGQAVGVDMPNTVVQVSRMADLANMHAGAKAAQKPALFVRFGVAVTAVQEEVDELTDRLQDAVNDTNSATLSGNLVNNLDSFRASIEQAVTGAAFGSDSPNVSKIVTAQSTLQNAMNALSGIVLKELGELVENRKDSLNYRMVEAYVLFGVALALIVVAAFWTRARGRAAQAESVEPTNDKPAETGAPSSGAYGGGYGGNPYDQIPAYGEVPNYGDPNATRRERSGALR